MKKLLVILSFLTLNCFAQAPQNVPNVSSIQWFGAPNCTWIISNGAIIAPCLSSSAGVSSVTLNGGSAMTGAVQLTQIMRSSQVMSAPSGACFDPYAIQILTTTTPNSTIYGCIGGNWAILGNGSGGSNAFSALTSSINTSANMQVGTGSILQPINSGQILANYAPSVSVNANCPTGLGQLAFASGAFDFCYGTGSGAYNSFAYVNSTSSITTNHFAMFASGTFPGLLSDQGLSLVTSVGTPGTNLNIPTEEAVRSAITAGGGLPSQTGNAGYLTTNGTTPSWGDLTVGPSGALCAGTNCVSGVPGIIDIVTSEICRTSAACAPTGQQDFSNVGAGSIPYRVVSSLPGTCIANQDVVWLTSGASGLKIYGCEFTNTWVAQGGGSGGSVSNLTLASGVVTLNLASCTSGGTITVFSHSIAGATVAIGNQIRQRVSFIGGSGAAPSTSTYLVSTFGNGTSGTVGNTNMPLSLNGSNDAERIEANWSVFGSSSTLLDAMSAVTTQSNGTLHYQNLGVNGAGTYIPSTDAIASTIISGVNIACGTTTGWTGTVLARYSLELWY